SRSRIPACGPWGPLLACGEAAPLLALDQERSGEGSMSRGADKDGLGHRGGSGVGRATGKLLAAEGATVIVSDINKPGGLETVQQIGAANSGRGARFEEHDTAKEADWKRIIDGVMAREGKLNGLANNA